MSNTSPPDGLPAKVSGRQVLDVADPGLPDTAVQRANEPAAGESQRAGFLHRWPPDVRKAVCVQYLSNTMTAIVLGALFDGYLLILRDSNTFVGTLESARGLTSLLTAIPFGWAADRYPKQAVLRINTVLGAIGSLLLLVGIPSQSVPLLFAGVVVTAAHNQCLFGILPAFLAENTEAGRERMDALSHLQTAASAGMASGPALQILLMIVTRETHWTLSELHWVLCIGLIVFVPLALTVWRIKPTSACSPVADRPSAETAAPNGNAPLLESEQRPRTRWAVAGLVEITNLITAIGSGMTFKYWPLFFKADFGFSPMGVCAMQLVIWAAIAGSSQLSPKMAKKVGRAPACCLSFCTGTAMLFWLSLQIMPAFPTMTIVVLRNAIVNSNQPLMQSIIMDLVPQQHRGKWSSIASLRRMTWAGSAFVGGMLSDSHDYRYAFFATACVHTVSSAMLVIVAVLRP